MAYLYILKNRVGKYYVGITELALSDRLKRHNIGGVRSTKFGRPWVVIHSEKYPSMAAAREREKEIKNWKGGNAFKKLIAKIAGSSNLPRQGGVK